MSRLIGLDRKRAGRAGLGRPKGAVNKVTKALKDMILGALDAKGGQKWLEAQMDENPGAFLTLLGKVLPQDIKTSVTATATLEPFILRKPKADV